MPRVHVRAFECVARIYRQHGFGVHVLAPEQELVQAQAVRRAIRPGRHVSRPLLQWSQRLLPVESVGDLIALEVIAARKAQELRLHVHEHLHEVGPEAVRLILERRRKQGDKTEPHRARPIHGEDEAGLGGRCDVAGLQRQFVLLPGLRQTGDIRGRVDRPALVTLDRERDRSTESLRRPGVKGGAIPGVGFDRNAPIARVGDAGDVSDRRLGHVKTQARADCLVEGHAPIERDRRCASFSLDDRPVRGRGRIVQKRAVLDELRVQASVVGVVDLFGHQAVEERTDFSRRRVRVDRNRWPRGMGRRHAEDNQQRYIPSTWHETPFEQVGRVVRQCAPHPT